LEKNDKMKAHKLVPLAVAVAAFYVMNACNGEQATPAASAGSSSESSGGTASAETGGAGAQTAGTGGSVTAEQCLAGHFSDPAITSACKDCMCQCNAVAASACDVNCWSLARCVQVACAGNMTDINCVTTMCGTFLAGAGAAVQATQCLTQCGQAPCQDWFLAAPAGGGGAGAGGDAAGGAAGGAIDSAGMSNQGGVGGDGAT
jgi:hypothetical protein